MLTLPSYKYLHHFSHQHLPPSPPLPSTIMCFHRWSFIERGIFENFQGLYERSMGMAPRCKEVRFVWVSCWLVWV